MKVPQPLYDQVMTWLKEDKKNYIGGKWVLGEGKPITIINPATEEPLVTYQSASVAQVNAAIDSAEYEFAQKTWAKMQARDRADVIRQLGAVVRKHRMELALIESLQNGKTFSEAYDDDMPDSADVFDYYAGWTDKFYGEVAPVGYNSLNYILREPLGVCGLIVPWNFPLLLAMWKLAPALATNNTVVMKPSNCTPLTLLRVMEYADKELNLPPGLINIVLGSGKEVGDALTASPKVAKISFTGSTGVGKKILESSGQFHLRQHSLELGGKSANIFFEDTPNIDEAIARSFMVMFRQKGEKCSEPTRFIIHESLYKKVSEKLVAMANAYRLGNPLEETTEQGPQCNSHHYQSIITYLEEAKRIGLQQLCGGLPEKKGDLAKGYYIKPTIYGDVDPNCRLAQEEIFGPLLCLFPFKTDAEALALANNSQYGLAAGLYTANISRAHTFARDLQAGMIFINKYGQYDFAAPFGGTKQSGLGREMAIHSMEAYTQVKSVLIAL